MALPFLSIRSAAPKTLAWLSMDDAVDHIISRGAASLMAPNGAGGVAITLHIGGRALFFNYGQADRSTNRPIKADSLFNIGSVRKVFEAAVVAEGVLRGDLPLDNPVNKYLPELHGEYIRQVTVGQLVCHTSGLLLPTDHPPWPVEHYSLAGFLDALNAWTPQAGEIPGKQRIYTHAGYVLLQLVLERRYGIGIGELLKRAVITPLGMHSTILPAPGSDNQALMSPALLARAVQGYSSTGEPIGLPGNQQSYYDFAGTGQMFSTARDLALLLAACLDERGATTTAAGASNRALRQALQLTQREQFRVDAQYGQAMAWEIENSFGTTIVDKPGGLNNASAYIGLVPEQKIGIAILVNRGDAFPFDAARKSILPELAQLWRRRIPQPGTTARQ